MADSLYLKHSHLDMCCQSLILSLLHQALIPNQLFVLLEEAEDHGPHNLILALDFLSKVWGLRGLKTVSQNICTLYLYKEVLNSLLSSKF